MRISARYSYLLVLILAILLPSISAYSSSLEITNIALVNRDDGAGTIDVQFDLSWRNSWRLAEPPYNWDAVWIFIKFRKNNGAWQHATLTPSGHYAPAGSEIELGARDYASQAAIPGNPGVGAFIYRSSSGGGTITLTGVRLKWHRETDGVAVGDSLNMSVHGIEMAYVPQDAFYAGDHATSTDALKQGVNDTDPW
jgi:hypothetical protein